MENFVIHNPVKLHFGKGVLNNLGKAAKASGKKALLMYGKGSVKNNGAYEQVVGALREAGINFVEYFGIKPNPTVEDVDKAAALGRSEQVEMVIAIGGGSVIDSAKYVAVSIPVEHSAWAFAHGQSKPLKALPLLAILTLAATGSEMNHLAVVQHDSEKKKVGFGHPLMFPRHSFLDPSFTLSVPKNYTAYGIVDLIAHALEGWFGEGDSPLTDRFIASIILEAIDFGPKLLNDLQNYHLRARMMYASTMALNGLTFQGKKSGDWGVHAIGHSMSVLWDYPHGATLSVAYPAWLKLQKIRISDRICKLGKALFGTGDVDTTIAKFEAFFQLLGSPTTIQEAEGVTDNNAQAKLLEVMKINNVNGNHHKLTREDHRMLVKYMFE